MKKIFLILALTTLISIGAAAAGTPVVGAPVVGAPVVVKSSDAGAPPASNNIADTFMAAFGMNVETNNNNAGPSIGGTNTATAGIGTSIISSTSANQVTPSFTPYSYK